MDRHRDRGAIKMLINKTIISGNDNDRFKILRMNGYWNLKSAIARARKSGISGSIKIEHTVWDDSGGGGYDGRYRVDANDNVSFMEN